MTDWTERNRMAMRRRHLRDLGRPSLVEGAEAAVAVRRIRTFHAKGMTYQAMAEQAGIVVDVAARIGNGTQAAMLRRTFDAIMRIQYVAPVMTGRAMGAKIPPVGTQRRLQAMAYDGFNTPWLADKLGDQRGNVGDLLRITPAHVFYSTFVRVSELYAKYETAQPGDEGINAWSQSRAVNAAKANGWAPRHCWDTDTLDDPDAYPEWTGACGTERGYRIHYYYGIPVCRACNDARRETRVRDHA